VLPYFGALSHALGARASTASWNTQLRMIGSLDSFDGSAARTTGFTGGQGIVGSNPAIPTNKYGVETARSNPGRFAVGTQ
jgi:hypothetical protein